MNIRDEIDRIALEHTVIYYHWANSGRELTASMGDCRVCGPVGMGHVNTLMAEFVSTLVSATLRKVVEESHGTVNIDVQELMMWGSAVRFEDLEWQKTYTSQQWIHPFER